MPDNHPFAIVIDGQTVTVPRDRMTGLELRNLVTPAADHVWLDLPDAQDAPISDAKQIRLSAGSRFFTDRPITIFLDGEPHAVTSRALTADDIRALPTPPLSTSFEIWKDIVDELDDPLEDDEFTRVSADDRFFSRPGRDRTIEVTVNRKPVTLTGAQQTGLTIKQSAIGQGVAIGVDFLLTRKSGKKFSPVGDEESIRVRKSDEFRAVDGDDNS